MNNHHSENNVDDKIPMDGPQFRVIGKEVIDYMVDYMEKLEHRRVIPSDDIKPGYLKPLIPKEAPQKPEEWDNIMSDLEEKIMPGMAHWNHPRFHAYFPSGNSYPSILGDMISGIFGVIGFSWASGPACTELEGVVLDWYARAMGLPEYFLSSEDTKGGGGVIQSSASSCVLVVMLAARFNALESLKKEYPNKEAVELLPLLVGYCSKEAHSCVEKAAKLSMIKIRILDADNSGSVTAETLEKAMAEDEEKGLKPFFYSAIFGSTAGGDFDRLAELAPVCKRRPEYFWLHVDAAYAGSCFICPEQRPLMNGIGHADSFNVNSNKWLLTNFDCSCLFVKDKLKLTKGLIVDPLYLQHEHENQSGIIDYRHWHVPLSRRFRSLKLWFVFRCYGINALQDYIRNHIQLAKQFENIMVADERFEIVNNVRLGLVCFRLKGPDKLTQDLILALNGSGKIHVVPAVIRNKYVIRFVVNSEKATIDDIYYAVGVIKSCANDILNERTAILPEVKKRTASLIRRLSFTRSISKELYKNRSSSLYDGATPILVPEEGAEEANVFDDVFGKIVSAQSSSIHKQ